MKRIPFIFTILLFLVFTNSCQQNEEVSPQIENLEQIFEAKLIFSEDFRIEPDKFGGSVRRCRVMKRYRPKGEIYRILVDVENPANVAFAAVDFGEPVFTGKNPSFNSLIENKAIRLLPSKTNQGNGQKGSSSFELEFSSEDFLFASNKTNQTLKFSLELYDLDANSRTSQIYQVTLADTGKRPSETVADETKTAEPVLDVKSALFVLSKSTKPGEFTVDTELTLVGDEASVELVKKSAKKIAYTILGVSGKGAFSSEELVFDINQVKTEGLRVATNFAILLSGSDKESSYSGDPETSSKVRVRLLDEAGKELEFKKGVTDLTLEAKHLLR